jgi:hypothetical protein
VNTPSRGTWRPSFGAVFGVIAALVLAGCAGAPAPMEHAFVAPARQGNPMAQFALGVRIVARAHTAKERAPGIALIRQAAHENLAIAQDRMGWMYLTGYGLPQNTSRALVWLHRAAARGAPAAQLALGQVYAVGSVLPVDKAKAYYWYSLAAKPVHSDVTIFNIVQVRFFARMRAQALAPSLTPAEREDADERVAAWTPTSSVPYSGSIPLNITLR